MRWVFFSFGGTWGVGMFLLLICSHVKFPRCSHKFPLDSQDVPYSSSLYSILFARSSTFVTYIKGPKEMGLYKAWNLFYDGPMNNAHHKRQVSWHWIPIYSRERKEKENLTNISFRLKYQGTQVMQSGEYIFCKWNKLTPVFVKRFGFDR